jgi:hypothetical protein
MSYKLSNATKEGWIYINSDLDDEDDEFIELVKSIHNEIGGSITAVTPDDTQYRISNDPL